MCEYNFIIYFSIFQMVLLPGGWGLGTEEGKAKDESLGSLNSLQLRLLFCSGFCNLNRVLYGHRGFVLLLFKPRTS